MFFIKFAKIIFTDQKTMKNRSHSKHFSFGLIISFVFFTCFTFFSLQIQAQSQNIKLPFSLEDTVITAPYVSYDQTKMLFLTEYKNEQILHEATLNPQGEITGTKEIESLKFPDSLKMYLGSPSYNQSASKIYIALARENSDFDLYEMSREGDQFSQAKKLEGGINSTAHDFDPCISPDEKIMYFVRNPETDNVSNSYTKNSSLFVCGKLYMSKYSERDGWSKAVLLPKPVNENCERSPRIAADGKSLYFSSKRDDLTNDVDLMYTKNIGRGVWLSPTVISLENTDNDDLFPSVGASGETVYSLKVESGVFKFNQNILINPLPYDYRPEKTVLLKGKVSDKESGANIPAFIEVQDPNNSLVLSQFTNIAETGRYNIYLPYGKRFKIAVYGEAYSTSYFFISSDDFDKNGELNKDIELFSKAELLLNVFDADITEPLEASVEVINQETGKPVNIPVNKEEKGRYTLQLPLGNSYSIKTTKEFYEGQSLDLDLRGNVQFDHFEKDTEMSIVTSVYEIELKDAKTGEGIETTVEIKNLSTGETITRNVKTDKDGKVKLELREGEEYEINVTPKGYAYYSVDVSLSGKRKENKTTAKLEPLEKETKIQLKRIFFEFNSADLNASSYEELDRVVKLLKNNPDIKIEISAHTDDVGSEAYNLKLSERRAESVIQYITEKGIPADALIAKGYGESQPAFLPADIDENREKNRRVEMKITETEQ